MRLSQEFQDHNTPRIKPYKARKPVMVSLETLVPLESAAQRNYEDLCAPLINSIADQGFQDDHPIEVIRYRGLYFILDGHKRSLSSLANDLKDIPAIIIEENEALQGGGHKASEEVKINFKPAFYYDWQDAVNYYRSEKELEPLDWDKLSENVPRRAYMEWNKDHTVLMDLTVYDPSPRM